MPLNMGLPLVQAEKRPETLVELGQNLCNAYGLPFAHYGIKGDEVHTSGYHRSYNVLTQVLGLWSDYSIQSALDNTNFDRDDCCALDFNPNSTTNMKVLTERLYQASLTGDLRLRPLRRVAGTRNGSTVFSFNCSNGAQSGSFNSSHLWHLHMEFWRSRVRWDLVGVLQVMLGVTMTPDEEKYLRQQAAATANLLDTYQAVGTADDNKPVQLTKHLKEMKTKLDQVAVGGVTQEMLNAAVATLNLTPAVVAALQSVEGKAAIVAAVNEAEDS